MGQCNSSSGSVLDKSGESGPKRAGGVFTRPQAGAYEANRRRRLLGRVGDFAAEGKVTRAGARNIP